MQQKGKLSEALLQLLTTMRHSPCDLLDRELTDQVNRADGVKLL